MKNKLKNFSLIFFVAFLLFALGLKAWEYRWTSAVIDVKGEVLNVLVAKNSYQYHRGLGKRNDLGSYDGMVFVYSNPSRVTMVMRKMKFPIDIVWFDKLKVVDIAKNVPTELGVEEQNLRHYMPRQEANVVLELPAGWADKHDLKIGDKMSFLDY